MGSDLTKDPKTQIDEIPQHEVRVSSFWIDSTEVTNAQFAIFVAETGYTTTAEVLGVGRIDVNETWQDVNGANWRLPLGDGSSINDLENHPVVLVSWNDADAYCKWAGGNLPTEAQWEYAARESENHIYPWGDTIDENRANFCDSNCSFRYKIANENDGYKRTSPVGNYSPSGDSWIGASDMSGNVWEWVYDSYNIGYYANSPVNNPNGPIYQTTAISKLCGESSWGTSTVILRAGH